MPKCKQKVRYSHEIPSHSQLNPAVLHSAYSTTCIELVMIALFLFDLDRQMNNAQNWTENIRNNVRKKLKTEVKREAKNFGRRKKKLVDIMAVGIPLLIIILLISTGTRHFRSVGFNSSSPLSSTATSLHKNVHYLFVERQQRCLSMALMFSRFGTTTTTRVQSNAMAAFTSVAAAMTIN